jgi:hypothetical protein
MIRVPVEVMCEVVRSEVVRVCADRVPSAVVRTVSIVAIDFPPLVVRRSNKVVIRRCDKASWCLGECLPGARCWRVWADSGFVSAFSLTGPGITLERDRRKDFRRDHLQTLGGSYSTAGNSVGELTDAVPLPLKARAAADVTALAELDGCDIFGHRIEPGIGPGTRPVPCTDVYRTHLACEGGGREL